MNPQLPVRVRALIRDHIRSVGELELLLTLHSEPERLWSVDELCERLECPPSWAQLHLDVMRDGGFVAPDGDGWRYAPADARRREAVDALDEAYRLHTREVLRFVFTRAGDDLRAFSDAFRVRRDPER